jgi:outer membrane protein assembly factor BamD
MYKIVFAFVLILFMSSCNEYQKALKSTDLSLQYTTAKELYQAESYKKAIRLFEYLAPVNKGKPNAEDLFYMLSDSYYKTNQFYLAAFQFESYVATYPKSERIEEAAFLGAKSYSKLSPEYSLDQTDTQKAIDKMQEFIDRFPESTHIDDANAVVKTLTDKIEKKKFETAKLYNTVSDYKSSLVALKIFLDENSGSKYTEDALYYRLDSAYNLAINSIPSKMEERLKVAKLCYSKLIEYRADSKYRKEADKMSERIEKDLNNLSK